MLHMETHQLIFIRDQKTQSLSYSEFDNSINLSSQRMRMRMRMMMKMKMKMKMTMTMMMTMTVTVIIMDHIFIYISKVHRHGIPKIRNLSTIPARSNVRVAANMF